MIQDYNSYKVIDLLLDHLEREFNENRTRSVKASIMNVIHDCLVFAAVNGGVGKTCTNFFNFNCNFSFDYRRNHVCLDITSFKVFKKFI